MRRRWTWLTLSLLALIAVVGLSLTMHPLRSVVENSWAEAYASLAEMTRHSDAVVRGTVTAVAGTETRADEGNAVYTNFVLRVDRWIAGAPTGRDIVIHQMGGASGLYETTVPDDPLLRINDQMFLFVRQYAPGRFFVLGGPSGRFPVRSGHVVAMPDSTVTLTSAGPDVIEQQLLSLAASQGKAS